MKRYLVSSAFLGPFIVLLACSTPVPGAGAPSAARPAASDASSAASAPGASPVAALHQAARTEGEVNYHHFSPPEAVEAIVGAFEKEFAGVKVSPVKELSPATAPRIVQESIAGRTTVDVAKGSLSGYLLPLLERNLLADPDWSRIAGVKSELVYLDGRFLLQFNQVSAIAYNTRMVSSQEVPKTWEDLLDPKWKGKMMLTTFGIAPSTLFFTRDEQRVVGFLEALREQNLTFEESPTAIAQKLAAGQYAIGEVFIDAVLPLQASGAPIALTSIRPNLNLYTGVYTLKEAPHPNAAKLLAAWLVSPKAIELTEQFEQRGPARPCLASRQAKEVCDKTLELVDIDNLDKARQRGEFQDRVSRILGALPAR